MNASTADRIAISEMLSRYAFAVDTIGNTPIAHGADSDEPAEDAGLNSAIEQLGTCIADDGLVFLYFEGPEGPTTQAGGGGPAEFGKFVRGYFTEYGYLGTYHSVTNVVVDFDSDDTATVRSYINSSHWLSGGRMLLAPILYVDSAVRDGSVWKIKRREIQVIRFWVAEGYAPDFLNDPTLAPPKPVQETAG